MQTVADDSNVYWERLADIDCRGSIQNFTGNDLKTVPRLQGGGELFLLREIKDLLRQTEEAYGSQVLSIVMRKLVCRLWLNEVSRQ